MNMMIAVSAMFAAACGAFRADWISADAFAVAAVLTLFYLGACGFAAMCRR